MKAILILNRNQFFFPKLLERFLKETKHEVIRVVTCESFDVKSNQTKKYKYLLSAIRIMGFKNLIQYVFVIAYRKVFRQDIKRVCIKHNVLYKEIDDVNSDAFFNLILNLKNKNNELIGLSMCSQIYRSKIINQSGINFYNFHPSLLPSNKGRFPVFWAIYNGDKQGVTCHIINEKIDSGDIIFQKEIHVEKRDTVPLVLMKLFSQLHAYFEETLNCIEKEETNIPNKTYLNSYGPTPSKVQIRDYFRLVKKL